MNAWERGDRFVKFVNSCFEQNQKQQSDRLTSGKHRIWQGCCEASVLTNSMFVTSPDNDSDSSLAELLEYSSRARLQKTLLQTTSEQTPVQNVPTQSDMRLEEWNDSPRLDQTEPNLNFESYSAPSAALREQDLRSLEELFGQDGIEQIEADILHNLTLLSPAPCWEDDPFDFLREYLQGFSVVAILPKAE